MPAAFGGLPPATRLGRYHIVRELAMGGMAELYVACHMGPGDVAKIVALKRVLPNLARDEDFVRMFLNEARIAAGLDHSNIVHVLDFGADGGEYFLAMEYVHGKSVHEILRAASASEGVSLGCALTIVRDVAEALHYAHQRTAPDGRPLGLVHRDVSPSNVLVSFDGEVKLADFGIATATALTRATRTGSIKGKVPYMAPEQLRGEDIDGRADVFSLGAILYELSTGLRCFYAPGEFALINRVVQGRFERPSRVRPGFPEALEEIIVRALQVDRAQRTPTARAFQVDLEHLATSLGITLSSVEVATLMSRLFGFEEYPTTTGVTPFASLPAGERTLESTWARRRRQRRALTPWVVAGGLGLGLGGALSLSLSSTDPSPRSPDPSPEAAGSVAPPVSDGRSIGTEAAGAPARAFGAAHEQGDDPDDPDDSDGLDIEVIVDADDGDAPLRRQRTTRRRSKPSHKTASPDTAPGRDMSYLPPSRRAGRP